MGQSIAIDDDGPTVRFGSEPPPAAAVPLAPRLRRTTDQPYASAQNRRPPPPCRLPLVCGERRTNRTLRLRIAAREGFAGEANLSVADPAKTMLAAVLSRSVRLVRRSPQTRGKGKQQATRHAASGVRQAACGKQRAAEVGGRMRRGRLVRRGLRVAGPCRGRTPASSRAGATCLRPGVPGRSRIRA